MSNIDSKFVRGVLASDRMASKGFATIAEYMALTSDSDSKRITEAAREAVLIAYPDTDPARLMGKNKNDDPRWRDARAMRAGLVRAIDREPQSSGVVNLLTRAGLKAELADVVAAWEAAREVATV